MGKIGDQAGFVSPAGHGNSHSNCFPTKLNFIEKDVSLALALSRYSLGGYSRLLPLRTMPSRTVTNSEMTWSTSSRPARTVMISELGFVYFLLRMLVKKTVRV